MSDSEHRRHCILVLDTSESMGASGIAGLRSLGHHLCQTLAPGDFLSIVLFADQARIVLPPSPVGPLLASQFHQIAANWQPAGNTNLEAGWLAALACQRALNARETSILLTLDGRANEGATLPEELETLGRRASGTRVGIFGLGMLCSKPQMEALAAGCGGDVVRVLLPSQLPAAAGAWLTRSPSAQGGIAERCG